MTELLWSEMNWIAVLIGAVFYMAFGALYYSPVLFGTHWMRLNDVKEGHMRNPLIYLPSTAAAFLGSFVMAALVTATGSGGWADGLLVGAAIALVVALVYLKNAAFGLMPMKVYGIVVLEHSISFLVLGLLHGLLR